MRRFIPSFLRFLCIILFLLPSPSPAYTEFTGKRIAEVRFEGMEDLPREKLAGIAFLKTGDEYSTAALRKSISYLYKTGLFSQVTADGEEREGGMVLTFRLEPQEWVFDVKVKGNRAVAADDIFPYLPLKRGREFTAELLAESEAKLKDIYQKRGFFHIDAAGETEREGYAVTVTFRIRERDFCRLTEIRFEGNPVLPKAALFMAMESTVGQPLSIISLEKDGRALLDRYHDENYLEAAISEPKIDFGPQKESAAVAFTVTAGPKYRFEFDGNRHFSAKTLRKIISAETPSPAGIAGRLASLITEAYRGDGFPFVRVDAAETRMNGEKELRFAVTEGERYCVGKIEIRGNRAVKTKALRKVMESGGGFFRSAPYSENRLSSDKKRMQRLYEAKGYSETSISQEISMRREDGRADILLTIDEGPLRTLTGVEFSGNSVFDREALLSAANLAEGRPFTPSLPDDAEAALVKAYSAWGFQYARIKKEFTLSSDGTSATLRFHIDEGPQVKMGKVLLRGNRKTKDYVILRELGLNTGDVYDAEKAVEDRHRLSRLGLFRGVDYGQIAPERQEEVKDVLIGINERKPGSVALGIGYASDVKLRGSADVAYSNLGGTGRSVRLRTEASEIDRKVLLGYREPWLLGFHVDGRVNLLYQFHEAESYDVRKEGIIFGLDRQFTDYTRGSLQYDLEKNRYSNIQPGAAQTEGETRLATIGPLLIRDSRDDPFNPSKGSVNILRYEIAAEAVGSDEEFRKTTLQSSWYRRALPWLTGALSLRGGEITLAGDSTAVPIDKRFFLGGRTTVRGYSEDSIGPKTPQGTAMGGEKMVNVNVEARIVIKGNFGGLLFYDAGNVWLESDSFRPSELRESAGLGLSYITPIGPITLEYGNKIGRKEGESPGEWYFTIGNTF